MMVACYIYVDQVVVEICGPTRIDSDCMKTEIANFEKFIFPKKNIKKKKQLMYR